MDVGAVKELQHLGQDCLHEGDRGLLHVQDLFARSPVGQDLNRLVAGSQLRVGGDGGLHVPGHVDLGHHGHVPGLGIGHDLADLILGIEAPMWLAVILGVPARAADQGLGPPGPHLGELGVLADLDPPALVVGQVPVEPVHLVQGQEVDVLQYEFLGHEVAGHVQVHAPPTEPGLVFDLHAGDPPRDRLGPGPAEDLRGQELSQGLHAVEHAGLRCRLDPRLCRRDDQAIALLAQAGQAGVNGQDKTVGRSTPLLKGQGEPCGRAEPLGELVPECPGPGLHTDPGVWPDLKGPLLGLEGDRLGDHVDLRLLRVGH